MDPTKNYPEEVLSKDMEERVNGQLDPSSIAHLKESVLEKRCPRREALISFLTGGSYTSE